jgi:hypothetical protein
VEQALHHGVIMIRLFVGFFLLFGVAGTLDIDPHIDLVILAITAAFGMGLMYSGISSIKFEE